LWPRYPYTEWMIVHTSCHFKSESEASNYLPDPSHYRHRHHNHPVQLILERCLLADEVASITIMFKVIANKVIKIMNTWPSVDLICSFCCWRFG
jgi:hypothetical protein